MYVLQLCHIRLPSVVIHNLHIEHIALLPEKTDPPLVVDANAVLASLIYPLNAQAVN